jgi:hypothetical protein
MLSDKTLTVLLICAASGLAGCKTIEKPTFSVYEALPGTWGWQNSKRAGCDSNPHVISFSEDRTEMVLEFASLDEAVTGETTTWRYKVLGDKPHLRVLREDEMTRNPATGRPVIREVIMITPDRYCRRRTDRVYGSCGRHAVRCESDQGR